MRALRRGRVSAAVALVSALLAGGSSAASAAMPIPARSTDAIAVTGQLALDGSAATVSASAPLHRGASGTIIPGCSGTLDRPHRSGGTASVHGRTVCAVSSRNYVSLSIGYLGWFGERYAVSGGDATAFNGRAASGFAKSVCSGKGWQTWRAFGWHAVRVDGVAYYVNTSHDHRFTC